eukprot:526256_1
MTDYHKQYQHKRNKASGEQTGYIFQAQFHEKLHAEFQRKLLSNDKNGILKNDISSLNKNGYLIIENLLSKDELSEIQKESKTLLSKTQKTNNKRNTSGTRLTERYYSTVSSTRVYDKMILNERVNNIMKYYLYKNYLLMVSMLIDVLPNEKQQRLHRDGGGAIYGPPKSGPGFKHPLTVSTMWAITDFTEDNGSTLMIPKSHLWNPKRNIDFNKDKIIKMTMPAGSVVIWFDGLIHGAGANITANNERIGALIIYGQPWMRPQENFMLSMPFEEVETLPKEIRKLIGYSVYGAIGVVRDQYGQGRHPQHAVKRLAKLYSKL